jgi:hypothetical protein
MFSSICTKERHLLLLLLRKTAAAAWADSQIPILRTKRDENVKTAGMLMNPKPHNPDEPGSLESASWFKGGFRTILSATVTVYNP